MKLVAAAVVAGVGALAAASIGILLLLPALLGPPADASTSALHDIPPELLVIYEDAARRCDMPWPVLAAVGKIETDHGRSALPGVRTGTNHAGAAGPMQFLGSTWAAYGQDGDLDGDTDIYSPPDAIHGAAAYLCANGAGQPEHLRRALWHYNHDDRYVADVLLIASGYELPSASASTYAVPIARVDEAALAAPHHDYPAVDVPVPTGTPVLAVTSGTIVRAALAATPCGGTVVLVGDDGHRYTYCHASNVMVRAGEHVVAGQRILLSGGRRGAPGAGRSTGPHLHLAIHVRGQLVCPQPLLRSWLRGQPADPSGAPRTGCTS